MLYLCREININLKKHLIMNKEQQISQPVPDFGALLESVRENGRLMREAAERDSQEWKERFAELKKERLEREKKWEQERLELRRNGNKNDLNVRRNGSRSV